MALESSEARNTKQAAISDGSATGEVTSSYDQVSSFVGKGQVNGFPYTCPPTGNNSHSIF
jgi:hypothetical protein